MSQLFLEKIKSLVPLAPEFEKHILQHFYIKSIPKSTILLKELQYCQHLYFLEKGTIRTYYFDKEKEVTSWFYKEGQFFSSWYSFYSRQASFEYIIAEEDCQIYSIEQANFEKLLASHQLLERFGRKLAEEQSAYVDHFSKGYMFMSARERYDLLLSAIPDITLRVNLGHIASFLGISQETLSRIRRSKA